MKSVRKQIFLIINLILLLVLAGCSGDFINLPGGSGSQVLESKIPRETISQLPADGLESLTSGNSAFALDLFQSIQDQSGNLFWRWNIPIELGHLSLSHKMRARSAIEIYKNNKTAGYLSIILPAHMGYIFIPRDVVQFMNQKGNQFEMKISLETRDKNNRTYSKPLIINKMLPVVSNHN